MSKEKSILVIAGILFLGAVLTVYYGVSVNRKGNRTDSDKEKYESELEVYGEIKREALESSSKTDISENANNLFETAYEWNNDTVAWLTIPDTQIDFPVMQTGDNDYYLKYSFQRETPSNGVPFLDYRCENDFSGFNSIIYGHNISGGRMFSGLLKFKNEEYFQTHNSAVIQTRSGAIKIRFFACLVTEGTSDVYQAVFLTNEEKMQYIDEIKKNAIVADDTIEVGTDSRIVLLSTCSYDFDDARTVVVGIIEEESNDYYTKK